MKYGVSKEVNLLCKAKDEDKAEATEDAQKMLAVNLKSYVKARNEYRQCMMDIMKKFENEDEKIWTISDRCALIDTDPLKAQLLPFHLSTPAPSQPPTQTTS